MDDSTAQSGQSIPPSSSRQLPGHEEAEVTLATLLLARRGDQHPGLLERQGAHSWDELVNEALRRATWLEANLGKGPPHLGVLLDNGLEYLTWIFAAALMGATVVGINPTRRGSQLTRDLEATDVKLVVTDARGLELLHDALLVIDVILLVDDQAYQEQLAATDEGIFERASSISPSTLLLLLFTSGTTGDPKAVRCTQGRLASIGAIAALGYGYQREDVCYCPMPMFHGNALMALVAPALSVGATIATPPSFSASRFLEDCRHFGATRFTYVGKAIAYLLATPASEQDQDHLLTTAFGTEASRPDREAFEQRFGCRLVEGYGASEGGVAINAKPGMPDGALGVPAPGLDVVVLKAGTGEECPRAQFDQSGRLLNEDDCIGEIVNRSGLGKFEGYYANEEAEQARTKSGWYWTGDLAYRDEAGWFYFAGRSGDWLRVDGENLAAGPIEALLARYPGFQAVVVYGLPDPQGGEMLMAAVELASTLDLDDFSAWLFAQADVGTKWAPRVLRVLEKLPETATGKITKVALKAEGLNHHDLSWWRADPRDRAFVPLATLPA